MTAPSQVERCPPRAELSASGAVSLRRLGIWSYLALAILVWIGASPAPARCGPASSNAAHASQAQQLTAAQVHGAFDPSSALESEGGASPSLSEGAEAEPEFELLVGSKGERARLRAALEHTASKFRQVGDKVAACSRSRAPPSSS